MRSETECRPQLRWDVLLTTVTADGHHKSRIHEHRWTRKAAERRAQDWQTNGVLFIPACQFVEGFRIEPTEGYVDIEEACVAAQAFGNA